jgi:hypothetical protein
MVGSAYLNRITLLPILSQGAGVDADVVCVDWNSVQLTDLVIAPMADTKMAKMFGIPVDDRDKEKKIDKHVADDGIRHFLKMWIES